MKRVPPPRSGLVEAMRALNQALDRAERLKNELEAFETELTGFRFLKIETDRPTAMVSVGKSMQAKSGR